VNKYQRVLERKYAGKRAAPQPSDKLRSKVKSSDSATFAKGFTSPATKIPKKHAESTDIRMFDLNLDSNGDPEESKREQVQDISLLEYSNGSNASRLTNSEAQHVIQTF